jgi:hypothetical protein
LVIKIRNLAIGLALVAVLAVATSCGFAVAGEHEGPAPNSGDGIPDGSGMEIPSNGNPDSNSPGPAPNSGEGISDGPGF